MATRSNRMPQRLLAATLVLTQLVPYQAFSLVAVSKKSTAFAVAPKRCCWLHASAEDNNESTLTAAAVGTPSELPDSLEDAAERAAQASVRFLEFSGPASRCRVDFDTSAGDETFTLLKTSSEFMQKYVSALSYAIVPGLKKKATDEMMRLANAKAELRNMQQQLEAIDGEQAEGSEQTLNSEQAEQERQRLLEIIRSNGSTGLWEGPKVRVYFPDEGSAALARRDWLNPENPLVPFCVEFSSCGGVQVQTLKDDMVVMFFCPKASESDAVEQLLQTTESQAEHLKLTVFVNPQLVDMGVTGFGMAGRMLRERLIDGLANVYYLRTLKWGALTRTWPQAFSVWQEDENAGGGYRLISAQDRLPSNPEVEDIYDVENGLKDGAKQGPGFLDSLGDFVNGMMKL